MSDLTVHIRGLEVFGYHGVHDAERVLGQRFIVDLALDLAHDRAATTDDLADTADYAVLCGDVATIIAGEPVALIERLAQMISDRALADPSVRAVSVTVRKPDVAIPHVLDEVAVTLRSTRPAT